MTQATDRNVGPLLLQNPVVSIHHGRIAATLAIACLLAHIPLIAGHFLLAPISSVVMGLVSLMCIPCARRLWCSPTTQDCTVAALLAATMVGLHLFLWITMDAPSTPSPTDMPIPVHHHGETTAIADPGQNTMPTGGMHRMAMSPGMEMIFYVATTMAAAQILLNVVAIVVTIRRAKAAHCRN